MVPSPPSVLHNMTEEVYSFSPGLLKPASLLSALGILLCWGACWSCEDSEGIISGVRFGDWWCLLTGLGILLCWGAWWGCKGGVEVVGVGGWWFSGSAVTVGCAEPGIGMSDTDGFQTFSGFASGEMKICLSFIRFGVMGLKNACFLTWSCLIHLDGYGTGDAEGFQLQSLSWPNVSTLLNLALGWLQFRKLTSWDTVLFGNVFVPSR